MYNPIYPEIVKGSLPSTITKNYEHDDVVLEMFLETKRLGSYKTAVMYDSVLNDFFNFTKKPIKIVTHKDILDYVNYLTTPQPERKALKKSTINMKLSVVKSFYKYLLQIGYVKFNPAEPVPIKRQQQQITNKLLTVEELKTLFKVAEEGRKVEQVILYFLSTTGCRVNELCNACMKDFFITPNGHIGITVLGKGDKTRVRKIRPALWGMITDYRNEEGFTTAIDYNDITPVIFTPSGNPYTPNAIWKIIKKIVKKAGLNEDITTHWFRHTFATHAASSGVDLWQLKEELGHSSITTTELYINISQNMENTSVDNIKYINEIEAII